MEPNQLESKEVVLGVVTTIELGEDKLLVDDARMVIVDELDSVSRMQLLRADNQ